MYSCEVTLGDYLIIAVLIGLAVLTAGVAMISLEEHRDGEDGRIVFLISFLVSGITSIGSLIALAFLIMKKISLI